MEEKQPKLRDLIRQYFLDIGGLLREEPKDPKFEFAFKFLYPNERGRNILVIKLKNKNQIEISNGTSLSIEHKSRFDVLDNKNKISFIRELQRMITHDKFEFELVSNPEKFLFVIIDRIFIKKGLSINTFYKSFQSIFSCSLGCVLFIQGYFKEDIKLEDLSTGKDRNSGLYL